MKNGLITLTNETTDRALDIQQVGVSAAGNRCLNVYSNANQQNAELVNIEQANASSIYHLLKLKNEGSGSSIRIDNNGAGSSIYIAADGNGSHLTLAGDPTNGSPADGDLWYDGSSLNFNDGSTTTDLLAGATGPSFRAYRTAAQTFNQNVAANMNCNLETWDTDSCYDTSTFKFTPTTAGYYYFTIKFGVTMNPVGGNITQVQGRVMKNGTMVVNGSSDNTNQAQPISLFSTTVGLSFANGTTDYFEFFGYQYNSNSNNYSAATGSNGYYVDAHWVRPL